MPNSCQTCSGETKKGNPCKRRTCLGKNVPYCWQHLPAALKTKYIRERVKKNLKPMRDTNRATTFEHLLRVYGDTDEEKRIIRPQLASVYNGTRGWSGKCFVEKGRVRAHIIMQQPKPLSRFVRQEFTTHRLLKVRKYIPNWATALYVQSIGVDKGLRRRGILPLLIASYGNSPLLAHADPNEIASFTKLGFREVEALREFDRRFMSRP
jgi:hypothetical protein